MRAEWLDSLCFVFNRSWWLGLIGTRYSPLLEKTALRCSDSNSLLPLLSLSALVLFVSSRIHSLPLARFLHLAFADIINDLIRTHTSSSPHHTKKKYDRN